MNERILTGHPISGSSQPSKSYGDNRVCREPGCETRLSRYNNGKYCYSHEPMSVPRTRGKKIA